MRKLAEEQKAKFQVLIGKSLKEASDLAESLGVARIRPSEVDGLHQVLTRDYRLDRLNVAVDSNGIITEVLAVG